jgi:hypothetical protein
MVRDLVNAPLPAAFLKAALAARVASRAGEHFQEGSTTVLVHADATFEVVRTPMASAMHVRIEPLGEYQAIWLVIARKLLSTPMR